MKRDVAVSVPQNWQTVAFPGSGSGEAQLSRGGESVSFYHRADTDNGTRTRQLSVYSRGVVLVNKNHTATDHRQAKDAC